MTKPAAVTVAVVSWNTRDLLASCLESMAPEVEAGRADVWVVDNASDDGSPALVEESFPWARLLRAGANIGFGPAVNLVAQRTSSTWIAPANADVALTPGALPTLLRAGDHEPRAGCLAPRLLLPDASTQPSVQRFPSLLLALGRNLRLNRLSPGIGARLSLAAYWDADRAAQVDWATGAFLLVRRQAWDAAGGFDESQWMYAEDLDLAWRLARAGWTTRYVPDAVVRHRHAAAATMAFGDEWGRRRREIEASYRWIARRRGVWQAWAIALVNAVAGALEIALFAILTQLRPDTYGARLSEARFKLSSARLGLRPRRRLFR